MTELSELKRRFMAAPGFSAAYDEAVEEYAALEAMIRARAGSNVTQAELAERMGTTQSAIASCWNSAQSNSARSEAGSRNMPAGAA